MSYVGVRADIGPGPYGPPPVLQGYAHRGAMDPYSGPSPLGFMPRQYHPHQHRQFNGAVPPIVPALQDPECDGDERDQLCSGRATFVVAHAIGSIGLQVMTGGPYREIMQKFKDVEGMRIVRRFLRFALERLIPPELAAPHLNMPQSVPSRIGFFTANSGNGTADEPFRIVLRAARIPVGRSSHGWLAKYGQSRGPCLAAPTFVRYEHEGNAGCTQWANWWRTGALDLHGQPFVLDTRSVPLEHLAEAECLQGGASYVTWTPIVADPAATLASPHEPPRSTTYKLVISRGHRGHEVLTHALVTFDAKLDKLVRDASERVRSEAAVVVATHGATSGLGRGWFEPGHRTGLVRVMRPSGPPRP